MGAQSVCRIQIARLMDTGGRSTTALFEHVRDPKRKRKPRNLPFPRSALGHVVTENACCRRPSLTLAV